MIDTHAHIISEFYNDIDLTINECKNSNIIKIINNADNLETSKEVVYLSKKYSNYLYAAVGIHPENINENSYNDLKELENIIKDNNVVAIGEIGLDCHYSKENKELQQEIFIKQLEISKKYNLPVIIHSREATDDMIRILKKYKPKGIIHCFSGSIETAREYIKLGLFLGLGGVITFKNANIANVIKDLPLSNIVLETDSPFLSPVPFRGKKNLPKNLNLIAKKIAEIKDISYQEVINITTQNALKIFNIH